MIIYSVLNFNSASVSRVCSHKQKKRSFWMKKSEKKLKYGRRSIWGGENAVHLYPFFCSLLTEPAEQTAEPDKLHKTSCLFLGLVSIVLRKSINIDFDASGEMNTAHTSYRRLMSNILGFWERVGVQNKSDFTFLMRLGKENPCRLRTLRKGSRREGIRLWILMLAQFLFSSSSYSFWSTENILDAR